MKTLHPKWFLICLAAMATNTFAAEAIDLSQTAPVLLLRQDLMATTSTAVSSGYQQTGAHTDRNGTTHIRIRQTWGGYPVWGADAIMHVHHASAAPLRTMLSHPAPGTRLNGRAYLKLNNDLTTPPTKVFTKENLAAAITQAIGLYRRQTGQRPTISNQTVRELVYVDNGNKAHWALQIHFKAQMPHHPPAIPTFIMDAATHTVYKQWDNLQTVMEKGGGYGGNPQMGKLVYDGLKDDLPALVIDRDAETKTCSLRNDEVIVKDRHASSDFQEPLEDTVATFPCESENNSHNQTFWDDSLNAANGGYSPDNDALFIGHIVQRMYQDWYGIPPLTLDNKPMPLIMRVHDYEFPDNAFWDGEQMTFSDGSDNHYPFTVLNIGAHEIGHGFTEQHADLVYEGQSGGLNESFSDMAGAAADFYAYGKNSWQLGAEISKTGRDVFRYMDIPSKDCAGREPGYHCSIDKASQFKERMNVHFSSGVFNRAFYLLSTSPGWDTHKAFDVMVKANQDYWTPTSTFQEAACGVMSAAIDLKYDTDAIKSAFQAVGLNPVAYGNAATTDRPSRRMKNGRESGVYMKSM